MELRKGFEQFATVKDLIDALKEMAGQFPGKGDAYYFVQGTPIESLYPGKNINYNGDQYDFTGWGPDRYSPWGSLPSVIVAVRSDLAKLIRGDHDVQKAMEHMVDATRKVWEKEFPESKPLRGKDWKPAPGFENY